MFKKRFKIVTISHYKGAKDYYIKFRYRWLPIWFYVQGLTNPERFATREAALEYINFLAKIKTYEENYEGGKYL